ncbi:MAG: RnfABCDGE type electron transport complex subunit D [Oscillospiraceae bacterium]
MTGLRVSPSPHRSAGLTTQKIMFMVIIALLPAAVMGCVYFGLKAALVLIQCIAYCVAFEALFAVVTKKQQTISDLSAVVTGLLLGMNLPATVPFYVPLIGSFFAIVIVKQLFGGIGQNFANPAIAARIVLMVSFSSQMTNWVLPFDTATGATPLAAAWLDNGSAMVAPFTFRDMLLGKTGGCIGETCALALIIGGIFLIATKIISPATPIAFIGVFGVLTLIYTGSLTVTVYQLLAGGLMIGAFFMATDYATTPLTTKGKIVFGTGCAIITFVIRQFGSFPEGVSFSILLMNLLTPYIDKLCRTKPLGAKKL